MKPHHDDQGARLAAMTARIDQATALIDEHLRAHTANRQLVDALLDVRNALRPRPPVAEAA